MSFVGDAPGINGRQLRLNADLPGDLLLKQARYSPTFVARWDSCRKIPGSSFRSARKANRSGKPPPRTVRVGARAGKVGRPNVPGVDAKKAGLKLALPEVIIGPPPMASLSVNWYGPWHYGRMSDVSASDMVQHRSTRGSAGCQDGLQYCYRRSSRRRPQCKTPVPIVSGKSSISSRENERPWRGSGQTPLLLCEVPERVVAGN